MKRIYKPTLCELQFETLKVINAVIPITHKYNLQIHLLDHSCIQKGQLQQVLSILCVGTCDLQSEHCRLRPVHLF